MSYTQASSCRSVPTPRYFLLSPLPCQFTVFLLGEGPLPVPLYKTKSLKGVGHLEEISIVSELMIGHPLPVLYVIPVRFDCATQACFYKSSPFRLDIRER